MIARSLVCLASFLGIATIAQAGDWPHWMGPASNGSSPETGLLLDWPANGPKVIWKAPGGLGYSAVSVAGDRAFTIVQRGSDEVVLCLDAGTGKEVWQKKLGKGFNEKQGNGPRSTPTIDGKMLYVQSVNGPLVCLETATGKTVWEHNILSDFNVENVVWGLCASPVIDGDLVLAIPGAKDASAAAYDKNTGKLVWKSGSDKAGYSTPTAVTVDGKRQAIFFTASMLRGVDSATGKELWNIPWPCDYDCNICTPLAVGNLLFVSSGEKNGCTLFKLSAAAPPKVVWESRGARSIMLNYWANSVVHDKYLYGLSGEFNLRINLNCVELATGKLVWSKPNFGKGAITLAEGHLFITTKTGDLVLVPASPEAYKEKARVKMMGDNRTVPTIAGKKLFLRDTKNILCLDLAK